MTEVPQRIEIAGEELERIALDGITYTYPVPRMPLANLERAAGLSAIHAVDGVVPLSIDPDINPAQGSYIMDSKPQALDAIIWAGEQFVPGFGELVQRAVEDRKTRNQYGVMGEILHSGSNVIHGLDHSSLPNIGVKHGLAYAVLTKLGFKFVAGAVFNEGVTTLGYDLGGDRPIPLPVALSLASDKTWYVIAPRFRGEIPSADAAQQNKVAEADIKATQAGEKGAFITIAVTGGSDKVDQKTGIHWIEAIKPGTLRVAANSEAEDSETEGSETYIQLHVGEIYGLDTPENVLYHEPRRLYDNGTLKEQGYELAADLTEGLNETSSTKVYGFLDPRIFSAEAIKHFRETGFF